MISRFKQYIVDNSLCLPGDRIFLAVSGGIDSVVMLDLFMASGYFCAILHCNFKLRGEESDKDELFVKELADRYEIPFFSRSFETSDYADANKLSIQMAARDLRYSWFEDIREEQDFDLVATAHNRNDIIETFMINLARGTGIHGLTGIKPGYGKVIRPLLFASRTEINDYAAAKELKWREDSTNLHTDYTRNKIRHQILPLFENINPRFHETMIENIKRLGETEEIYDQIINKIKKELLVREPEFFSISIEKLKGLSPVKTWLFELLQDFNFTPPVISDIAESLDSIPGRQFFSVTHRLVKDREKLIIIPVRPAAIRKYYIEDPYREVNEPLNLDIDVIPVSKKIEFSKDPSVAYFDLDKLHFPLIIRKWEQGDYFRPFGMMNMKKLSDYFIDQKLSIPEKENIWLLTSGPDIIWVIGMRTDDRFRISSGTQRIMKITMTGVYPRTSR